MDAEKKFRAEKQYITSEYHTRLSKSPFFLVVNYKGLTVAHFNELRKRLRVAGAELHVIKNSIFRIAAKEAGLADLTGELAGQVAVITGHQDIASAAKTLKNFQAEFDKPKLQFGFLGQKRLDKTEVLILADLPPLEVLRAKLVGAINAPAGQLVQIINTPAAQLVRVLEAKAKKGE